MPTKINGTQYLTASDLLKELDITRQTLWRWRREGKIPAGHRFRNRQVIFSPEEVEVIRDYANRIEPISDMDDAQLSLFNGGNGKGGAR
jgi:hypothetical protein